MAHTDLAADRTLLLHVRYNGRSFDLPLNDLGVNVDAQDRMVKTALAHYLDIPVHELNEYVVDRHEGGNWTIRPEAVFG